MDKKIPVRIDTVTDSGGGSSIEVFMELGDFESTGPSIRSDIRRFKEDYLEMVKDAARIGAARGVPTRERWRLCKMLSDFNLRAENKFEITNSRRAYARDFGLPARSIRTYLDFGRYFSDGDVVDGIPYSTYAELCFKAMHLKSVGKLESEKKRLLDMHRNGMLPSRDEYREQLKRI